MFQVLQTEAFESWLEGLGDREARFRIVARVRRLSLGHFGDVKRIGGGLSELRIDFGPGYRVYFVRSTVNAFVLLMGGDKSSQQRDVARARTLAKALRGGHG